MSEPLPGLLRRLLEEHQRLLPALRRWVQQLPEAEPSAARAELEQLAGELRRHARLEEQTLFAAMGAVLGSQALAGYEMQHDDIDEVLEALLAVPPGLPQDAPQLADRLLWFCESHFEIEEKHIFPESLKRLSPEQWSRLEAAADPV